MVAALFIISHCQTCRPRTSGQACGAKQEELVMSTTAHAKVKAHQPTGCLTEVLHHVSAKTYNLWVFTESTSLSVEGKTVSLLCFCKTKYTLGCLQHFSATTDHFVQHGCSDKPYNCVCSVTLQLAAAQASPATAVPDQGCATYLTLFFCA